MSDPQVAVAMLLILLLAIFLGFPVAFTLMALGVAFGYYAYLNPGRMWRAYERAVEDGADAWTLTEHWIGGFFNNRIFDLFVNQTYSVISNDVLTAIPLFLFMGYIVERANIIERLFGTLYIATRHIPGSMAVAALITCTLFATATGIVGAVVTLMGLLAFPAMLKARYDVSYASGVICAGGTLGILIPPSILLIVYGATAGVSVVRMYAAALLPGLLLAGLYLIYVVAKAVLQPQAAPKPTRDEVGHYSVLQISWMLLTSFVPLAVLILAVLGAILFGLATPSEAAAIGALGGVVLAAAYRALTWQRLKESVYLTARTTAMVCWLFVGSATFASVFAYLGGQQLISDFVTGLDMSPLMFLIVAQIIIFILGWPLEWTEIIVIFVPIFLPLLAHFEIDPLFFGVLVAVNLQTAFLSPPMAMSAYYLKG
ncbi:MAG: TRAP transporter large permease subunit, partial [Mesorhizobium sp.]